MLDICAGHPHILMEIVFSTARIRRGCEISGL